MSHTSELGTRDSLLGQVILGQADARPSRRPRRRRPSRYRKPDLTCDMILAWADAFRAGTGRWPHCKERVVAGSGEETWRYLDNALRQGNRGLPGGSSLTQLLAERRGVRNPMRLPPLSVPQILDWADGHLARTGGWPQAVSGRIPEAPGERWATVDAALMRGIRELAGGSSLARLLAEHRGVRNRAQLPRLTEAQIVAWADQHHAAKGRWPKVGDGAVDGADGEEWRGINIALHRGERGLDGGSSLARVLARHRGVRNEKDLPPLTEAQILRWASAHRRHTGQWPTGEGGPIHEAPGETWQGVDQALRSGRRQLPGGSSVAQLLAARRGVRNRMALPRLTERQIVGWALAHQERTGKWPSDRAGTVMEAPEESWRNINLELRRGGRGLPGGSSLYKLKRRRCPQSAG